MIATTMKTFERIRLRQSRLGTQANRAGGQPHAAWLGVIAACALLGASGCSHTGSATRGRETLDLKSCNAQGFDQGDAPNEAGQAIFEKLEDESTTAETVYSYFSHYSPVIRYKASGAMVRHGKEAMPFLIKALQSSDKYKIRAACDTMSQVRGFFGVNVHLKPDRRNSNVMAPEINAEAVPFLAPLLDHEDMYVRMGALQALSRCGKTAAPHLPKVVTLLTDDEWWLRSSAAYVLQGVGSPETDAYLPALTEAMLEEIHVQCLNIMSGALKELIKSSPNKEALITQLGAGVGEMSHAFHRSRATAVLESVGPDALVILPTIDRMITALEQRIAQAEAAGTKLKHDEAWELKSLTKMRDKLVALEPQK